MKSAINQYDSSLNKNQQINEVLNKKLNMVTKEFTDVEQYLEDNKNQIKKLQEQDSIQKQQVSYLVECISNIQTYLKQFLSCVPKSYDKYAQNINRIRDHLAYLQQ